MWGKYDRFISVELAHEIAEKLPNAQLAVIDKSGHYVHMDKPQELVQVVTKFLHEAAYPMPSIALPSRESSLARHHVASRPGAGRGHAFYPGS